MRSLLMIALFGWVCIAASAGAAWAGGNCAMQQVARMTGAEPGETQPPLRIFDLRDGEADAVRISYNGMLAVLAEADVVFLGEQHDDPASHHMEWRILRDLTKMHSGCQALSLEMFERDTQRTLNAYLRGELTEDEFLAASRPWPNYPADYRPLIELAKAEGLPVVAANIPRPLASRVAKQGLEPARASYSIEEYLWTAASVHTPLDLYWELFYATMGAMMGGHGRGKSMPPSTGTGMPPAEEMPALEFVNEDEFRAPFAVGTSTLALVPEDGPVQAVLPSGLEPGQVMVYQIYQAQCIKDDTMAESIVLQRWIDPRRPILHVNGTFHSDYHQGTVARLIARRPQDRVVTVAMRPCAPLSSGDPSVEALDPEQFSMHPPVADFLVFVPAPESTDEPASEDVESKEMPAQDKGELPAGV